MRKSISPLAFLLAALALPWLAAPPALAEAATAFTSLDKAATKAADELEADCLKDGMSDGKRKSDWKRSIALGDGQWALVVDGSKLACNHAALCGTGGCTTQIFSSASGKPKLIFDDQARGWKFVTPATGTPWLKLDMHGGFCGKTGMEVCNQRLDLANGKMVRVR